MRGGEEADTIEIDPNISPETLCFSPQALANGVIDVVRDIVYVKPALFDATRTPEMATQIGEINEQLFAQNRPYLLIGPGRWGSSTHTLGIPVNWGQISAARAIIETTLEHFAPDPSQGSHSFRTWSRSASRT